MFLSDCISKKKKDKRIDDITELDAKVEEFLDWDYETFFKDDNNSDYRDIRLVKDLIEKMAVWYELRYPEDTLYRIYNNEVTENDRARDYYYSTEGFMYSLNGEERELLKSTEYSPVINIYCPYFSFKLRLNKRGIVKSVDELNSYIYAIPNLVGLHINECMNKIDQLLKDHDTSLEKNCDKIVRDNLYWSNMHTKQREGILDSVMYRIIERGGSRVGPRRALLFASEFQRDISIPMIYGVDTTDPHLRDFINDYLKLGGDKELVCKENYLCYGLYFGKSIKVSDLLYRKGIIQERTPEEKQILSNIAGLLRSQVGEDGEKEVTKVYAEKNRLLKKLRKSRMRRAQMEKENKN